MSSLEWFTRLENAIRISLPEISSEFDEFGIHFETNTTEIHPTFSFYMDTGEYIHEFCVIQFDPVNQEFYAYHYNEEVELDSKVLFNELDEMLQFIYDSCVEFLEDFYEDGDTEFDEELFLLNDDNEPYEETLDDGTDLAYELAEEDPEIEWISNDKHIHIENNHFDDETQFMIHLKMGVDLQSGDAILYRNVITKSADGETEATNYFSFTLDEAAYISDLLDDYVTYHNREDIDE
ncbi:hypothetical protein OEV98_14120 [Caldibacillus lycopersici]|uniref:Uncharacterized protein n=1 Tax=Perspicuibacillus lycopersici TaxID=1325689 RepID=A0AAE3IWH7_9BACI|nr:hypothetical protein [Perspicuibacillus lycopersici]MCU9614676.1 hypothetical protein [Perspicuibacillus lycopersici]